MHNTYGLQWGFFYLPHLLQLGTSVLMVSSEELVLPSHCGLLTSDVRIIRFLHRHSKPLHHANDVTANGGSRWMAENCLGGCKKPTNRLTDQPVKETKKRLPDQNRIGGSCTSITPFLKSIGSTFRNGVIQVHWPTWNPPLLGDALTIYLIEDICYQWWICFILLYTFLYI
jgi:hypothetical protein